MLAAVIKLRCQAVVIFAEGGSMGMFDWLQERMSGATVATAQQHAAVNDPRVAQAIAGLMSHVEINKHFTRVAGTGGEGPVMHAVRQLQVLHEEFRDSPELHYAYASALQVALQGATAEKVLQQCAAAFPAFWLAQATLKQKAIQNWNLFLLPEFTGQGNVAVHGMINEIVTTNILLATRRGITPRAVLFLRDAGDEFPVAKLNACKIEFMTTISDIKVPQVVAINGRIHDDPSNPYQCEITQCPFRPFGSKERLPYELLARQESFDFAILDRAGRVKHVRQIKPSNRMKGVHARLADMLEKLEGPELNTVDLISAIRKHQASLDPAKIAY